MPERPFFYGHYLHPRIHKTQILNNTPDLETNGSRIKNEFSGQNSWHTSLQDYISLMDSLLHMLNEIYPLSPSLKLHLCSILEARKVRRRAHLLKAGQVCRNICFIEKGLLRCYYIRHGAEVCSWFMKERDVVISVDSFFRQQPGYEYIQALEDTILHFISYEQLQQTYQEFPEFNYIGRVLTERYYSLSEQRLYSLRMQRAIERYQFMLVNFPDLNGRVPGKHLASYLGITSVTLSKIRSKYSKNKIDCMTSNEISYY